MSKVIEKTYWECPECKVEFASKEDAENCRCNKPCICQDCGKEIVKNKTRCEECHKTHEYENIMCAYKKAEKLHASKYKEPMVYDEFRDLYFDVESAIDEGLKWAFAARPIPIIYSVNDVLDYIADNQHDDFNKEDLEGVAQLEKAIDAFLKKQKVHSWELTHKTVVIILSKKELYTLNRIFGTKFMFGTPEEWEKEFLEALTNWEAVHGYAKCRLFDKKYKQCVKALSEIFGYTFDMVDKWDKEERT